MNKVLIVGSTGSIGQQTLEVIAHLKNHDIELFGICARGSDFNLIASQITQYHPKYVGIKDLQVAKRLQDEFPEVKVFFGEEGILELCRHPEVTTVVSAFMGLAGLDPTVHAIRAGKKIALANKEVLVSAGHLIMPMAKKFGAQILPVDSEHSAIFQCLQGSASTDLNKLILTSSGGPFKHLTIDELQFVGPKEALKHPTWRMGPKITIDSSTLMNKGLEVIEARWLFGITENKIDVVVHPQSIVHSMCEMVDGSLLLQAALPDMHLPIQYALTYPTRVRSTVNPIKWNEGHFWNFYPPDLKRFPCLGLAYDSLRVGNSMACFMNGANEVLVSRFLKEDISWIEIASKLEKLMHQYNNPVADTLEAIKEVDTLARTLATNI